MKLPYKGDYRITQGFGGNPQTYARFGLKGHNGWDIGLPNGTSVFAPHSGTVREVANDPTGYGIYIKIESDIEGSVLAHLREAKVAVGQSVTEGQLVAYSDNTGFSTGAHLHWGYFRIPRDRSNGYGGFIDQSPFIEHTQDDLDTVRKERDRNWNLYQQTLLERDQEREERNKNWTLYQEELKKVGDLTSENTNLKKEIQQTSQSNARLADELKKKNEEDAEAIDSGLKAQSALSELQSEIKGVYKALGVENQADALEAIRKLKEPVNKEAKEVEKTMEEMWRNLIKGRKLTFFEKLQLLFS